MNGVGVLAVAANQDQNGSRFSTLRAYSSPGDSLSVSTVDSEHLVKDYYYYYYYFFCTLGSIDPEG